MREQKWSLERHRAVGPYIRNPELTFSAWTEPRTAQRWLRGSASSAPLEPKQRSSPDTNAWTAAPAPSTIPLVLLFHVNIFSRSIPLWLNLVNVVHSHVWHASKTSNTGKQCREAVVSRLVAKLHIRLLLRRSRFQSLFRSKTCRDSRTSERGMFGNSWWATKVRPETNGKLKERVGKE